MAASPVRAVFGGPGFGSIPSATKSLSQDFFPWPFFVNNERSHGIMVMRSPGVVLAHISRAAFLLLALFMARQVAAT
jgi:hypothetical protein